MPSSHLILCHPLLLLPSIFPSIRVFSKESTLRMRWPKYWSFSFSISPSNEHRGLSSFRMDWLVSLQSKRVSRVFCNTIVQRHQFFGAQLSLWSNSHPYMTTGKTTALTRQTFVGKVKPVYSNKNFFLNPLQEISPLWEQPSCSGNLNTTEQVTAYSPVEKPDSDLENS